LRPKNIVVYLASQAAPLDRRTGSAELSVLSRTELPNGGICRASLFRANVVPTGGGVGGAAVRTLGPGETPAWKPHP
jgi:hypothetical protein